MISRTLVFALGASTLLGSLPTAQAAPKPQAPTPANPATPTNPTNPTNPNVLEIPFEKYMLKNGLTVILHQDNRLPLVAVSVWYDVGALHEQKGRSGFAHLFEHMMFQASPNVGEDKHFKYLEAAGGTNINGTTGFDRTNYFETVPSNELELALWLESDRMGFLPESLTRKSLDNQIEVVSNERRQSVENRPYGLMYELITKTLYPEPHPYHGDVIGSLEDISKATVDDVKDFFATYYTPANATLTIAGDIEPKETKALVEKYFGTLVGRPRPAPLQIPPPPFPAAKTIDFEEPVGRLAKVVVTWPGPSSFAEDTAALDLLAHVLSGTRSARLDRKMTFDDLIAQSVTAYFSESKSGGRFSIDVTVRPGRTTEEAEAAINAVLADLKTNPPTEIELKRAVNSVETNLIEGLQVLGGFGGRAERLQLYQNLLKDPGRLAWDVQRYRNVTTEDLSRVLDKYLGAVRLTVHAKPKTALAKRDQASQETR